MNTLYSRRDGQCFHVYHMYALVCRTNQIVGLPSTNQIADFKAASYLSRFGDGHLCYVYYYIMFKDIMLCLKLLRTLCYCDVQAFIFLFPRKVSKILELFWREKLNCALGVCNDETFSCQQFIALTLPSLWRVISWIENTGHSIENRYNTDTGYLKLESWDGPGDEVGLSAHCLSRLWKLSFITNTARHVWHVWQLCSHKSFTSLTFYCSHCLTFFACYMCPWRLIRTPG